MHAASVYPEPGSNSLNMLYTSSQASPPSRIHIRVLPALLTLKSFFKNSKEFSESLYFGHQNTWILLFNFQWAVLFAALPCGSQLIYYTTLSFVCQEVFQTFFKFFSSSRLPPTLRCRSLAAPIVYHILPRLSTPFCKFFQDFSIFPAGKVTALGCDR